VPVTLKIFAAESTSRKSLRVGSRLDKYQITEKLGEGGFSTVYAATDLIEDRPVALKIPDNHFVTNSQSLDELHREVRIMARLEHPCVLPLKDARFIDGHFVIVFPLGEETLADRLTRRLARATAIDLIGQMISAVAYAHEQRVLHRDIKPENFILFPNQGVQLTDFGLARIERRGYEESASGTIGYMSPEQAMGRPSFRSDVFSLGLVMYRMLAGKVPEYPFENLPAYTKFRRGLSQEFVALVRKAIDPSPAKRFRDAVAMHNSLSRIRFPLSDRSVTLRGFDHAPGITTRRVA